MSRKLTITVDTEAFPVRAEKDCVNRLIYGESGGKQFGIPLMMDIAEKYNVKLTFFLDLPEYYLYGETLLDVGRYILECGHDLQIHLHMDAFIYAEFWKEHGLSALDYNYISIPIDAYLEFFSREHMRCALMTVMDLYGRITSACPVGYRSAGYLLTPLVVDLLAETGIPMSCNYNAALPDRAPLLSGLHKPFRWHTGMVELPVACLPGKIRATQYNFNLKKLFEGTAEECAGKHVEFLDAFFSFYGNDSIAAMVMHSWSFFRMDEKGHFSIPDESAPEKFEAILRTLSQTTQFLTVQDIARDLHTLLPDLPVRPADPPDRAQALSCIVRPA